MILTTEWKNKLEEWALDAREGVADIIGESQTMISVPVIENIIKRYGGDITQDEEETTHVVVEPGKDENEKVKFSIKIKKYNSYEESEDTLRVKEKLLHEFAHVYMIFMENDGVIKDEKIEWDTPALTETELSATYFARAFLMPKNEFIRSVLENSFNNLCKFESVAEIFKVRIQAVIDRGRDLMLWE